MRNRSSHSDVPRTGWSPVCVIDLGETDHTCQMCGQTDNRYVHVMRHPTVGDQVQVGRICASKMTGRHTT
jgi:hypothetical protein